MEQKRKDRGAVGRQINTRKIECAAVRGDSQHPIDPERKRMWFRASTAKPCDDGWILAAKSWGQDMSKPDGGLRHVPFVDSHNYSSVGKIFGKTVDFEDADKGFFLLQEFAADGPDPMGRHYWYLYSNDYAQDGSVSWETLEEGDRQTVGDREYRVGIRNKLLEFSGCVLGLDETAEKIHGNPDAAEAVRYIRAHTNGAEDGETDVITEKPDRIGEILAELHDQGNLLSDIWERINLVELAMGRAPGEQFLTDEEASILRKALRRDPGSTEPRSVLPPELRKLAEVNSDLTGEALRDRLKEIQRNATE